MQSNALSDKWQPSLPYALKLYLYLGVGFVVAIVVFDQWLRYLSSTVVLDFGAIYSVIVIAVGRWLFERKTL